tara:strand:+ start:211 stop:867 length:657 start_codon:yes stop_codon:yes gene_type:complete
MFCFLNKSKNKISSEPVFSGSIEDFNLFFSGFCRNSVQKITRKYKLKVGSCEHCGVSDIQLESAHILGKERKAIISKILSNYIQFDNVIKINLNKFEEEFVNAHKPIEQTIKILCKKCHTKYDSGITNSKKTQLKTINMNKKYFEYARLTFIKEDIELLSLDDRFTIYVKNDNETFSMTKKEFYETFSNVTKTKSYIRDGNYNYSRTPSKAYNFLVQN